MHRVICFVVRIRGTHDSTSSSMSGTGHGKKPGWNGAFVTEVTALLADLMFPGFIILAIPTVHLET